MTRDAAANALLRCVVYCAVASSLAFPPLQYSAIARPTRSCRRSRVLWPNLSHSRTTCRRKPSIILQPMNPFNYLSGFTGMCLRVTALHFGTNFLFSFFTCFLVACYANLHPALSVRPSIAPSVTLDFFGGFAVLCLTAPAQMIK